MGPRSTSRSISEPDGLVVGVIKTPHGVRGEVRVDPRTDVAGRFREGAVLECDDIGPLTVASVRGEVIAAAAVEGGPAIADPFRRTADAVSQIRSRGKQLRGPLPWLRIPTRRSLRAAF